MSASKQQGDPELKRKGGLIGKWRDRVLSTDGPQDPSAKLVAVAVARFINTESMDTFVSIATLAGATGLNEKTVRRQVTALLAARWLMAKAMPSKGWVKPRILMLSWPLSTAGTTPGDGRGDQSDTAGTTPAGTADMMPGDAAGTTPGEGAADIVPDKQRASCPPTAGMDDAHSGHLRLPQRAPCPTNLSNLINPGEHGAKARRPRGPAQGARNTIPEAELRDRVLSLHRAGEQPESIVKMFRQYGAQRETVEGWIAAELAVLPVAMEAAI